jgi:hypothetical protein
MSLCVLLGRVFVEWMLAAVTILVALLHPADRLHAGHNLQAPSGPQVWDVPLKDNPLAVPPPPASEVPTAAENLVAMIEQEYDKQHDAAMFATAAAQRGSAAILFRAAA